MEGTESGYAVGEQVVKEPSEEEGSIGLSHSLGYDCTRRDNLQVLEKDILLYVSGNLLHFFNPEKKRVTYLRRRNGITAVRVHPVESLFAVAERGLQAPTILIFTWPQLDVHTEIREEGSSTYSSLCFNTEGSLMCLQKSEPSFLISVWDWRQRTCLAQSEGDPFDVYTLLFSPFDSTFITTSGYRHINFWRIVETGSGMKMDKIAGRFGRKPITDIEAFIQLSDGKVLSGTTWGSFFLWYDGKIKTEIKRRDMSTCHAGSVLHFVISEGELISTGSDGWIRVWDLESIQNAENINSEKEDGLYLLDPINEIQVAADAILESISKSRVQERSDDNYWYIQDAGGGIWKVDLSFSLTMKKPEKIFQCHAGGVTCLVTNPLKSILISGGDDGQICAYNLKMNLMVNSVKYNCGVTCLQWFPLTTDSTAAQVLIGFADGVLRLYYIKTSTAEGKMVNVMKSLTATMKLLQAIKPHKQAINKIAISKKDIVATASVDKSVFLYRLEVDNLIVKINPIGFLTFDTMITALDFKCVDEMIELMVGDQTARIFLHNLENLPAVQEESVSMDRADYQHSAYQVAEVLGRDVVGLCNAWFDAEGELRVVVDVGGRFEYFRLETGAGDGAQISNKVEISHPTKKSEITKILNPKNSSLLMCGFSDGYLKIVDISEWTDYCKWKQAICDAEYGKITDIIIMEEKLITSAMDGTLFVFTSGDSMFRDDGEDGDRKAWNLLMGGFGGMNLDSSCFENIHDIEDPNHLCIEDMKVKTKEEQTNKELEEKRMKIQKDVSNLKRDFRKLLIRNEILPREFQIPKQEFQMTEYTFREIQENIDEDIEKMKNSFKGETDKAVMFLDNLKRRYFDPIEYNRICVKGLLSKQELSTFRLVGLKEDSLYNEEFEEVSVGNVQQESYTPKTPRLADGANTAAGLNNAVDLDESVLSGSQTSKNKTEVRITNDRILKALCKQEEKRERKLQRKREWDDLYSRKPRESDEDPSLIIEIKQARENIGDFKRKTSNDFKSEKNTKPDEIAIKLNEITRTIYTEKKKFNEKVLSLQREKKFVIVQLEKIYKELIEIQDILPTEERDPIPAIPVFEAEELDIDIFYIEQKEVEKIKMNLILEEERIEASKRSIGSRKSSKASLAGRKFSRQHSTSSIQNPEKKSKVADTTMCNLEYLEEDENDDPNQYISEDTYFESATKSIKTMKAKYQQSVNIAEMNRIMNEFDEEIFEAVGEKDKLEARLKYAELSLIFLFEEFHIIRQDQELEAELKFEVYRNTTGLEKISLKLKDIEKQLKTKKKNVENFKEQKRSIDENVERELSDNKHADFLWELYNKKPPTLLPEDCYADIALEMSAKTTFFSTEESGNIVSEADEIKSKPDDLDMETYKLIRNLRNSKHDTEAQLSAERRLEDNIGRELSNLKDICRRKETLLKESEEALHSFMLNKQRRLNDLDQLVIVNLYDLRYLDGERLSQATQSSDNLLAFPEDKLAVLQQRTEELKYEKNRMKKKYKETKTVHENLIEKCKHLRKDIQTLDKKCRVEMEKRFGSGVTLETLEGFAVNRTLEEMKESLLRKEKSYWRIQDKKKDDIKQATMDMNEKIFENTDINTKYTDLQRKKLHNMEQISKWTKLIDDNKKKMKNDRDIEVELNEMVERYQNQALKITEMKALLMRYLMKSETVDPSKKHERLRPLTAKLRQQPPSLTKPLELASISVEDLATKSNIPSIRIKN